MFQDVARFMLTVAENPGEWQRQCVAITTKYTKPEETEAFQRLRAHMASGKKIIYLDTFGLVYGCPPFASQVTLKR